MNQYWKKKLFPLAVEIAFIMLFFVIPAEHSLTLWGIMP